MRPPPCRHGDSVRHVLNVGTARIMAGGVYDILSDWDRLDPALFICVGGFEARGILEGGVAVDERARALLPSIAWPLAPLLVVEWRDFGAPNLSLNWWRALLRDLRRVKGDVILFCLGGHGRTGTALSILAHLAGVCPGDPVEWVRQTYCNEAVESPAQVEYLSELGIPTEAGPSHIPSTTRGAAAAIDGLDEGACIVCTKPAPWDDDAGMAIHATCWRAAFSTTAAPEQGR